MRVECAWRQDSHRGEANSKEVVGEEAGLANRAQLMKDLLRKNREFSSSLDNEKPVKGCCEGQ